MVVGNHILASVEALHASWSDILTKPQLPDPNLVADILAALERYPFATLSVIVLAALCLGIMLVVNRLK